MSKLRLTIGQALNVLEGTFLPLKCVARDIDYGNRIGIRIYGPGHHTLLTREDLAYSITQRPDGWKT